MDRRKKIYARILICFLSLTFTYPFSASPSSGLHDFFQTNSDGSDDEQGQERLPIPTMPSELFQKMTLSQLDVLANSLTLPEEKSSKVESIALYLPQENIKTGQLEFTPVVLYPDPKSERIFICSDADSGKAPTLPKALTKLPGFAHATTLLPGYPMISSSAELNHGVGVVEEVMCDPRFKNTPPALSVPLLSGSQTVGVLLVSPRMVPTKDEFWTDYDRSQVSGAAQSLSMALTMDNERNVLREQNRAFRDGLSDSLHQVKNPLQALRTYGKILQRQMTDTEEASQIGGTTKLFELVDRLMTQSERVVDLMIPMDNLVDSLEQPGPYILNPAKKETNSQSLVLWENPTRASSTRTPGNHTIEEARANGTLIDFSHFEDFNNSATSKPTGEQVKFQSISQENIPGLTTVKPHQNIFGDEEPEMLFVTDVLEPIFSAFQAISSEHGIMFDVIEESAELPGVMAAPKSLQEAVSNLLDNAIKYVSLPKEGSPFLSNPSPKVLVRILANSPRCGVTILVEDNGPGIRKEEVLDIFQRGFRSDATNFVQGSGIGLDISLALVQQMGGVLVVAENKEFPNSLDGTVMALSLYRD